MKDHPVISEGAFVIGNNTFFAMLTNSMSLLLHTHHLTITANKNGKKSIVMSHKIGRQVLNFSYTNYRAFRGLGKKAQRCSNP
jgi:hypothetical protein